MSTMKWDMMDNGKKVLVSSLRVEKNLIKLKENISYLMVKNMRRIKWMRKVSRSLLSKTRLLNVF